MQRFGSGVKPRAARLGGGGRVGRESVRLLAAAGGCIVAAILAAGEARAAYTAAVVSNRLEVTGNGKSDALALRLDSLATLVEVDVGNDGTPEFSFDRSLFDQILVAAGGGNDLVLIDEANGVFTDTELTTVDGGPGHDTLMGGAGAELFIGGDGKDFVRGGRGDDVALLGADADSFLWNPGDGSDTLEGQEGDDVLVFEGANVNENIDLSANGQRLRFFRDIGNVVMDANGVEEVDFEALGGADVVTVADLTGTSVERVHVGLASGSGTGDGQPDSILEVGTPGADSVEVAASGGVLVVAGLAAELRVEGAEPASDRVALVGTAGDRVTVLGSKAPDLVTIVPSPSAPFVRATVDSFPAAVEVSGPAVLAVDGLGGNDTLTGTNGLGVLGVALELYGGKGDDTLVGGDGADLLFGGGGRDVVHGGRGNDVAFLGGGADSFVWDPGDGSDTVEGEGGADALVFDGSNVGEHIDLSPNGQRLRFFRDVGTVVMDVGGVERVDFAALGGPDTVVVNDLAGTGVKQVNLDLEAAFGGGVGDAQPDTVVVNGTPLPDKIRIAATADAVLVTRRRGSLRIEHSERTGDPSTSDSLVVNGLGSVDKITQGAGVDASIQVTINPD